MIAGAALLSLLCLQSPGAEAARAPFEVHVDERVELLTTVARLAGFDEFNRENSKSPYSAALEKYFAPFATHAAVEELKKLRATRGVSFDAVPSFAVHIGELPELVERIPFDSKPERFDVRWGGAGARPFLVALRDFAAQSKASEFFASQRAFYAQVEERLSARLSQSKAPPWFDTFFGVKRGAKCTPIPGLLCGGGNFGMGVRFPDGRPEEITPVLGCWSFDAQGVPVFDESYLPLFIHELCHTYTNPFVDRFEKELAPAGERLFSTCKPTMTRQAYGTWKTMLYESLVRASVVRCRLETEGKDRAREQANDEVSRGFKWTPELALLLGDFSADRATYPGFESFMPKVVAFFDAHSVKAAETYARTPKVESTLPMNEDQDVDPATKAIVIRFDRPMTDQSWSIVGKAEDQPKFGGTPSYDESKRVLTLAVTLEPGRSYKIQLNSATKQAFKSAEGVSLEPYVLRFSTRK